jgi:ABC-type phosphate transport system ATPase subunit
LEILQEAAILYENKGGIKLALENLADASLINDNKKIANDISDRLSQEIIIALIGPVGSGVSTAGKFLEEVLRETF